MKSKKILILRNKEIFSALKSSLVNMPKLLDPETRVNLEKKLNLTAEVSDEELIARCGWTLLDGKLRCICCLRQVPLSVLKSQPELELKENTIKFDPVNFHKHECVFSNHHSMLSKSPDAYEISRSF